MTLEKRVQNKIVKMLDEMIVRGAPIVWFRREASGPNYKKGLPDLYVVVGPLHVEIEVKKPGGVRSPLQEKWAKRFKDNGTYYILTDNADECIEKIRGLIDD